MVVSFHSRSKSTQGYSERHIAVSHTCIHEEIQLIRHRRTIKRCLSTVFLIALLSLVQLATAQVTIKGVLKDFSNQLPVENANVRNVYTLRGMTTGSDGRFELIVKKGELIEISKLGYQTLRIRIQSETEPLFYSLDFKRAPYELKEVDVKGKTLDFKHDSLRYRETYDIILRKEGKGEVDMQSMPLAMLSKKNRQEWAFQEMYAKWEKEKFIDYTFNERLVGRITYLQGENLKEFMSLFRPSYNFLRNATQYEYLEYIKRCYQLYSKK